MPKLHVHDATIVPFDWVPGARLDVWVAEQRAYLCAVHRVVERAEQDAHLDAALRGGLECCKHSFAAIGTEGLHIARTELLAILEAQQVKVHGREVQRRR